MAAMTLWILSPEQKKFILARNRGDAITREELESLLPVYAGGNSGPLIYILIARPRNVDGENIYKSKLGPNIVRYYVGSANQKGEDTPSGSKRAYEHGDQTERLRDQTNEGPKQFYQYGFGDPATDSSDYEKPCILAFEILTIPASFHGMRAPTLFFEAAICDLTHSYGTDAFKSIRTSARAADGVPQPASIINCNTSAPYAVPKSTYRRKAPRVKQDPAITHQNLVAARRAVAARESAAGGRKITKAHNYGAIGGTSRHYTLSRMFKDGLVQPWSPLQANNDLLLNIRFLEWDIVDGEQCAGVGLSMDGARASKPVKGDKVIFTLRRFTTEEGDTDLTLCLEAAGQNVNLLTLENKNGFREKLQYYLSKVKLFHGDTEPWKDAVKLEEYYAFLEHRATVGKLTGKKAEAKVREKERSRQHNVKQRATEKKARDVRKEKREASRKAHRRT